MKSTEAAPLGASKGSDVPSALLLALIVAASLFAWTTPNHYLPWLSFHSELAMAASLALAATWVTWKARRQRLLLPAITVLTLATSTVPALQLLGGLIDFGGDAWLGSLYLLGFALAQLAGFRATALWTMPRVVEMMQWIALIGALLSVWIALYQWQGLQYLGVLASNGTEGARAYANLLQPNQLATLLVLGLVAGAFLYQQERLGAVTTLLVVVTLGFGLAMTQSRAGMLEVVVVGAFLAVKHRTVGQRLAWTKVLFGVALILMLPLAWEALRGWSVQTGSGRDVTELATVGVRRVHWESMLDAIWRQPWAGYGWNQVGAAQLAVAPDHPPSGETLGHSHNLLLDLLVWNGLPLGLALAAGLAWWFQRATRGARDSATVLALASIVAVFVHAMLEYPLHYAYFLLPVGALMGAVSSGAMPHAALAAPRWIAPLLLALACGITAAVTNDYFTIEEDVRRWRFGQARIGMAAAPQRNSQVVVLTQLESFLYFAQTPEREGMNAAELNSMAAVVRRFPSKENTMRYAAALAVNDRPGDASEALRRICKINPPAACNGAKSLWRALGSRKPAIARVPWPPN
ncbi:MAG: Wzy polymerase domain-containing protein [Pseudomonadota bacterium]